MVRVAARWPARAVVLVALCGCQPYLSAELPDVGACIKALRTSGSTPIDSPDDQVLGRYEIVACDAEDAEFRVTSSLTGEKNMSPWPCPAGSARVLVEESGEVYEIHHSVCLEDLR